MAMLTEDEWDIFGKLLSQGVTELRERVKSRLGDTLDESREKAFRPALDMYFELSGIRLAHPNFLWHHRLGDYGPECPSCGHLLRTPRARFCANCGLKAGAVVIDWAEITSKETFYDYIFKATNAPSWHGRNLDAINDTWLAAGILDWGPPFHFTIKNQKLVAGDLSAFASVIREIAEESVRENGGSIDIVN